ncbi:MAG: PEPxxWA-CTERM sorting domain-containing protein [Polymorphobacter sp.]|uniref:PEPxxWA-CTERM sorting domain-containing protein n=1 Tax=Polymorphobacter sp. TaxID=1909290 RepID=UPI003A891BE1
MRKIIFAAVMAIASASSAQAVTLFSQDFDTLPTTLITNSVPGFTVSTNVDIVAMPNTFGIACAGGSGACIDLDGTRSAATITTDAIAFKAGQRINISFDVSGSQRGSASDGFSFNTSFAAPTALTGLTVLSGFTSLTGTGPYTETIAGTRPFLTYALSFIPTTAGSLALSFGTTSADNVGPMLDNVVVSQVPEPASWAMLIAGFGLIGAAMRRRYQGSVSPA